MIKTNEQEKIHNLFKEHLRSIGVVSVSLKTKGFKKYYTIAFLAISAYMIIAQGFPLWILVIPIIPIVVFWILYIVDLNIMIQCLVDIQKMLIEEHNLVYDLNQLLDELQDYAKENNFFKVG